ncbi:MAG TPA: hypothetical protein VLA15_04600, partial [Desulfurivibrionaceae bacterium]|nr:hypothetical protein [Desulfurivibrionaceae bacterium]
ALAMSLAAPVSLAAQFRMVPAPENYGDPGLRDISVGLVIPELVLGEGASWAGWSSSFLEAEGKPPLMPEPTGDEEVDMEAEYDYSSTYAAWTTMYAASSLLDGNPSTAWVEGVPGPGLGEVVIARIAERSGLGIRSGFQRSQDLFTKNARPRRIRVWLLAAGRRDVGQYDDYYYDIKALASREVELRDAMGWQALPLPEASAPPTAMTGLDPSEQTTVWFVAVQILSVYPGSRWEDCCISDIGPIR